MSERIISKNKTKSTKKCKVSTELRDSVTYFIDSMFDVEDDDVENIDFKNYNNFKYFILTVYGVEGYSFNKGIKELAGSFIPGSEVLILNIDEFLENSLKDESTNYRIYIFDAHTGKRLSISINEIKLREIDE